MSETQDPRSPEQIQRDIHQTRAEMSETLDAIRNKLSPGEMLDQALDYFSSKRNGDGGGINQWASNLGDSVKSNPMAAALIGAGVAWLMLGGSRDETTTTYRDEIDHRTPPQPSSRYTPVAPSASPSSTTHDDSGGIRQRAGEMAASARERVSEAGERVGGMAASTREHISDTTDRLWRQARRQGGRTKETFGYLRDEQPLVLGAVGFAMGAALGAGLPPTQREDDLMGATRDQVVQSAQEMGEEQLDRAKQIASAASDAALRQAQEEGLTQESADQTLRQTAEKIERVASASVEAAKRESEQQEPVSETAHPGQQS